LIEPRLLVLTAVSSSADFVLRIFEPLQVPVAACAYYEDMYVDFGLSQTTASSIQGLRLWVTSEYQHSGIREDGPRVLEKLLALASEQHPLN
jgi:hypothetical protein